MPLSLHQIFASVWSGWLATWPTQLIAVIWIGWLISWTLGSFWAARTVKRPVTWRARVHRFFVIIGGVLLTTPGLRRSWANARYGTLAMALRMCLQLLSWLESCSRGGHEFISDVFGRTRLRGKKAIGSSTRARIGLSVIRSTPGSSPRYWRRVSLSGRRRPFSARCLFPLACR